jgi:hypothetical protein
VEPQVVQRPIDSSLKGVGGWLMLFCVIVTIISPLRMMVSVFSAPFEVWQLADIGLTVLSISAGVLIWAVHRAAIPVLRVYFIALAAFAVLGIVGAAVGGDTEGSPAVLLELVRTLIFVGIWSAYFWKSERVRANFGRNLF